MRHVVAASLVVTAMGCQTLAGDEPARIVNPNDASRTALQNTVSVAMHTDVTLAADALTKSNILTVERNPPRSMSRPNPQGRIMEAPFRFQLVTNNGECILIDDRNNSRYILADTDCAQE